MSKEKTTILEKARGILTAPPAESDVKAIQTALQTLEKTLDEQDKLGVRVIELAEKVKTQKEALKTAVKILKAGLKAKAKEAAKAGKKSEKPPAAAPIGSQGPKVSKGPKAPKV